MTHISPVGTVFGMHHDTGVQFNSGWKDERVWLAVSEPSDPTDIAGEIAERITLDIPASDFLFLKQLALYRNALAQQTLVKKPGQSVKAWSRKSLAELFLRARIAEEQGKFAEMFRAVGGFPAVSSHKVTKEEKAAMVTFVKRVLAWDKKTTK